ncbi:MAG: hypothetical protein FJX74_19705, partial [Armatimonadetes bacterium]|nr:hypothetical protein [Armatimonadota bacterium]
MRRARPLGALRRFSTCWQAGTMRTALSGSLTMEMPESRVACALAYAERGWRVLPLWWPVIGNGQPAHCTCGDPACSSVGKHLLSRPGGAPEGVHSATADPETIGRWWQQWPYANIGIACGPDTGLLVLDIDGVEGRGSVEGQHLPPTPCVRTANGSHYYYVHPAGESKNAVGLLPGVDVRAAGGYVVAPGSTHATGHSYEWAVSPDDAPFAECPQWLVQLLRSSEHRQQDVPGDRVPEGQRNDTLTSLAGTMRRRGMGEAAIRAALLAENAERCDPPLPAAEVDRIARSVSRYAPEPTDAGASPPPGDHVEQLVGRVVQTHDPQPVWQAVPALARLTRTQYGSVKQRLTEALRDRLNLNDLDAAVREARAELRAGTNGRRDGQPLVVIGRQLREVADEALGVLVRANEPPELFVRSGALVGVAPDERHRPVIYEVGVDELRARLARVADFVRQTGNGERDANPPEEVVRSVLAAHRWPFPALETVVEMPVLRPDGSLVSEHGYDPSTRLYLAPKPDAEFPPVPDQASREEVQAALALVVEMIVDFPFVEQASEANALGLLLTPIVRPAIRGPIPIGLVDAPQAGTGKGLLAACVAVVATGRSAAMFPAPRDDDEWRKRITAALASGASVILIDNLSLPLQAPSLASALTAEVWQDRVLGKSETVVPPQRATWIVTGNNITLRGDLPRRCYWIRLDAAVPRPWQREGFRHPDLLRWVLQSRGRLVSALLTLARAWFAAGQPRSDMPQMGSYEEWAGMVGGILPWGQWLSRGFLEFHPSPDGGVDTPLGRGAVAATWCPRNPENPGTRRTPTSRTAGSAVDFGRTGEPHTACLRARPQHWRRRQVCIPSGTGDDLMASDKQIEANRQNALASTGPRTEEGKAIVAQNALK